MKQSKFSEERIAYILRQAEGGTPAVEVCRQNNPAQRAPGEQTFYRWKKKYGGTGHPLGGCRNCGACASSKKKTASSNNSSPT